MLRFRLALPLVYFAVASSFLAAQSSVPAAASPQTEPHFPTNEDLRHVKALSGPQLSPDGKQILFTVTHAPADGGCPDHHRRGQPSLACPCTRQRHR
jgi:hypothetical protein